MLKFLKQQLNKRAQSSCRTVLVEKTDRLYRNLKDWVTLDELDLEIHFVKENIVLSPDSRSSEKFMHGIKVLMAKNYIDNLSEETKKGMLEKAEQGIYPSRAPIGYINVDCGDKRFIQPDPEFAPLIRRLYELYAAGRYSLKAVTDKIYDEGLCYRRSRAKIHKSFVHQILTNRIYTGDFEWNGKFYTGTHEPVVTKELWDKVQIRLLKRDSTGRISRNMNGRSRGLLHAATAAVLWWLKRRKASIFTITAQETRVDAQRSMSEKKNSQSSSVRD